MWTKFFDMSSGGYEKTDWTTIYIELPEKKAVEYFESKFGINPNNVTCSCCGRDFYISKMNKNPVESKNVLIIRESEIENI